MNDQEHNDYIAYLEAEQISILTTGICNRYENVARGIVLDQIKRRIKMSKHDKHKKDIKVVKINRHRTATSGTSALAAEPRKLADSGSGPREQCNPTEHCFTVPAKMTEFIYKDTRFVNNHKKQTVDAMLCTKCGAVSTNSLFDDEVKAQEERLQKEKDEQNIQTENEVQAKSANNESNNESNDKDSMPEEYKDSVNSAKAHDEQ